MVSKKIGEIVTEDTIVHEPMPQDPLAEQGEPGLSSAYTLGDIADWLYRALKSTLSQPDEPADPGVRADAEMALAVYEDLLVRTGEGVGF